jgi:molybdopterin-guanine dinucleotide biosynthesis protein B
MEKPKILGFYGESNTGKTTTITELIKSLTLEGFNVSTVKITDKNIELDVEGKDTWKHAEAGSSLVVLSSATETDYLIKKRQSIDDIVENISNIGNFDIILVEGANDEIIPKIRIGDIEKRTNTVFTYDGDFEKLKEFVKNQIS